jgi:ATP-binding cassette subfamily F protein 3
MLHINDISYRIEGRILLDRATASIPYGHKIGLIGRNGTGKTTLLRIISGELVPDEGSISLPNNASIQALAQEAPSGRASLIDTVLAADSERTSLLTEAKSASDPDRISEIHTRLGDIGAHSAPARAAAILKGLGFDEDTQQCSCAELSGGWRMRVALAAVLFSAPDLLLLDEPSNYLDIEGTLWLENFLKNYPHTVLVVSHDRDLLNRVVDGILHLEQARLGLYSGGYDQFEAMRREKQRLQLKLKKQQDGERRRMEAFVERFRAKATKAKQAQSRLKALQKMRPVAAHIEGNVPPFLFPNPVKKLGNPLIRLENAAVGYANNSPVLRDLNVRLDLDDRIGLLGANGNGKSTFAKLLAGRLEAMSGHRRGSKKMITGFFAQHQMDELNPDLSPYDYVAGIMPDATEAQKRARLGQIGFGVEKADTMSANLSGGEKARLLFALASFNAPHLLILDEPTNHLDVDSRQLLVHALNAYEGAVILISHDRHLMEACADRLWIIRNQTVETYAGDMDSYRRECLSERGSWRGKKSKGNNKTSYRVNRQEERRSSAKRRQQLAPLRKQIKNLEEQIEMIGEKIAALDGQLADPSFYQNESEKAAKISRERGHLAQQLAEVEKSWLAAMEEYEAVQ